MIGNGILVQIVEDDPAILNNVERTAPGTNTITGKKHLQANFTWIFV